jgi:hypothetical protein
MEKGVFHPYSRLQTKMFDLGEGMDGLDYTLGRKCRHGEAKIGGILISQQEEQHTQQHEYLIDPLSTSHVTYKELNLGGEDNNHCFQPPKLHPMDTHTHTHIKKHVI